VLGQRVDRPGEHDLVVCRRVGAGVARSKDGGECLAGGDLGPVEKAGERVEAVGSLPSRGRQLLVGVRPDDRGVHVEAELGGEIRLCSRRPGPCPRFGPSPAQTAEMCRAHPVEHPPGSGLGGDGAEQPWLIAKNLQVADRVRPVRDGDGEVGEHAAWVMDRHRLVCADEDVVPGIDQPGEAGQLPEQLGPGMGDHPSAVSSDSHLPQSAATLVHLEGAFP